MSIQSNFEKFHAAHPEVYEEFCKRVEQLRKRNIKHYSSDGILHILRFHSIVDGRDMEKFKINNNYSPYYARLWRENHPGGEDFFSTRIQKS